MKQWLLVGVFGILIAGSVVAAPGLPREINLIFDDRAITLNFDLQPELLQRAPQHFLRIGEQRFPVDFGQTLPTVNDFVEIETEFELQISSEKLYEFFEASSIFRDHKGQVVEIQLNEDGDVVFEGVPHDGYEIEFERLVHLLNKAIASGEVNVRVPAQKVFSEVVAHPDLQSRGIREIVAIGESNFAGSSSARRQNILAAAKKFNGHIIKQGTRFSFNKILESVKEADGFVKELVIKGNKTEKELGGGVCQVSTTVYRAAFSGGFPIVVRRNHSYAVPYYKPYGLDATIYLGAQDFRFKNDTPGDILIQTFIEGDNLFFVFYGTHDGRKVTSEGPFISDYRAAPDPIVYKTEDLPEGEIEQVSAAHDGFRSEWLRRVEKNGEVVVESFISNYRPWPARLRQGTKISQR